MTVDIDVRDAARRRAATRAARPPAERSARGLAAPAGDLDEARRRRGVGANALSGTPSVLAARGPARGTLVEQALARMRRAVETPRRGFAVAGRPLELVPDPQVRRTSAGTEVVHLHQHHRGIPVFEAVRSVHFDAAGRNEIVGDHVEIEAGTDAEPALSAADAAMAAARYLTRPGAVPGGETLEVSGYAPRLIVTFPLPSRPSVLAKRPFAEPVTAHLVWLHCGAGDTRLGWLASLTLPEGVELYDLIVAANGDGAGKVLYCKGSVRTARGRGRVWRHDPDDPGGRVDVDLPLPREAYPAFAAAGPADPFGRPWIAKRHTQGNNAVAYRGNENKTFEGTREDGAMVFAPADGEGGDQRLLNAFYYCNLMHDFFALLGFGEAEGNFQKKNFTGAPGDRDALEIRVFPGEVEGTARMRSRRDGKPGELTLGIHGERHSALDADLVFHEFAHGVTNRLVGGRLVFEPLAHPESRALDEGYADYFALTIQSHQLGEEKTVFGAWLTGDAAKGLRRQPYDDGFTLSYGDLADPENHEPHRGGEIWCAALVRMNRGIGRALEDPARGHEIGWQLVLDSLELLPVGADQPGFLDGRDAISRALTDLAAAGRLDAAEHPSIERAVLSAFARTGMGPAAAGRGAHFEGVAADFTGAGVDLDLGGNP